MNEIMPGTNAATVADVRKWAAENGIHVGQRGRLSAQLKADYTTATGRPVASSESAPDAA